MDRGSTTLRSVWDCSAPWFSAPLHAFLPNGFCSTHTVQEKKRGVVRAPKEVLHKNLKFVELLHGGVCGAEFMEQS